MAVHTSLLRKVGTLLSKEMQKAIREVVTCRQVLGMRIPDFGPFHYILLFLFVALLTSCGVSKNISSATPAKLSPEQLRRDYGILRDILYHNHPSLYWYASKDSVDNCFASTYASLQDSLTEQEFRNRIIYSINKIRCGHTAVRSSKKAVKLFSTDRRPYFPLALKLWADTAVVVGNAFPNDSVLKRGTVITAINGRSLKEIRDSMFQLVGTDGYADIFKYQFISFNFPAFYRYTYGVDSQYSIIYLDSLNKQHSKTIKSFTPRKDSLAKKDSSAKMVGSIAPAFTKKQLRQQRKLQERNMKIDSALSAGILSVNTFSGRGLNKFFKKSFKRIEEDNLQNVVLDLRLNSGGDVMVSSKLTEYLTDKPFKIADTIAAKSRSFKHGRYISSSFFYSIGMFFSSRKKEDGRYHFSYFEKHNFKPARKHHFSGNIYVLTGGYTFSASTLVAKTLKGQENVKIVGEETGGGSYGTNAFFLPTITLPESGIRVTLPLYRMVLNAGDLKTGRGVFPDVEVPPTTYAIRQGIDLKMEKVKELISQRRVQAPAILQPAQ